MNNYETNLRYSVLINEITELKGLLQSLYSKVSQDEIPWDNSDMIRNWKISERTLADWRKKNLISYVHLNGKIWYTRQSREAFLTNNTIPSKGRRAEQ